MTAAVEIRRLSKLYGENAALDRVDLKVEEGSIFGFLGPNGAGKTTTLRILTGLAKPTSGTVRVLGHDVASADNAVRAEVGFLPDVPGFYEWMTAEEFLRFAGRLFGIERRVLEPRIEVLLDLAGLTDVDTAIGGYSRGMKQRLGVAQALINAPRLLMLDEPTSALDPMGRKDVLDMLVSLRGRTTVFFSTHILSDVERICDTVAILDQGRVVVRGPIDEIKARYGAEKVVVEVESGADELADAITRRRWAGTIARPDEGTIEVTVNDAGLARVEIAILVGQRKLALVRMEAGEMGLEEVFVQLVGRTVMSGFAAFCRKEASEILRTWRIWVLPGMMLFFALTGPFMAKFTPEIVQAVGGDQLAAMMKGLPAPTYPDSYAQWAKNLTQIALFAIIIIYGGLVSAERKSGTAILVLTKPVSRSAFVFAKAVVHSVFLTLIVVVGTLATWGGTYLVFGEAPGGPLWSAALAWLAFGVFFLAVMTLLSTLLASQAGAAGIGLGVFSLVSVAGFVGWLAEYSPAGLSGAPMVLAAGKSSAILWPVILSLALACLLVAAAAWAFKTKEL